MAVETTARSVAPTSASIADDDRHVLLTQQDPNDEYGTTRKYDRYTSEASIPK